MNKRTVIAAIAAVLLIAVAAIVIRNNNHQPTESAEPIRIGAILPLTGPSAFLGEEEKNGIEAARTMLETATKRRVEVIYEDSKNEAKSAISAFTKLHDIDTVPALIVTHSGVAGPISEYVSSHGSKTLPVTLATIVASTKITLNNDVFLRAYPSGKDEASAMATYVYENLGVRNPAIFYQNDDYGLDALKQFSVLIKKLGGSIAYAEAFPKDGNDHRSSISAILEHSPDAIYVVGNTPSFALAIRQLREARFQGKILSGSGFDVQKLRAPAGAEAVQGVIYTSAFASSPDLAKNPHYQQFEKSVRALGSQPSMLTVYPAVCVELLVRQLDSAPGKQGAAQAAEIANASHSTLLGDITFDSERNAKLPIFVREAQAVSPEADKLLHVFRN